MTWRLCDNDSDYSRYPSFVGDSDLGLYFRSSEKRGRDDGAVHLYSGQVLLGGDSALGVARGQVWA